LGIALLFRRKNLQRHQPVKPRLACLVNRAHAAATEKSNNLEVGKELRHLVYREGRFRLPFRDNGTVRPEFAALDVCFHGQVQGHEAAGA
jgi:hypothetical protein